MSKAKLLIVVVFAAAALLRVVDAFRPINRASWRECDLGSVARNFAIEGMNPLYPRIDWRGDGPGFAEMEVPILPFLTAATYQALGVHDQIGRFWSLIFSLATLYIFYKLAREYLEPISATFAFAFFAFNPLIFQAAAAIQPESVMLLAYVTAVYFFVRWLREERELQFWLAALFAAVALLAKLTSAHIGLLFAFLFITKYGRRVITQPRVWAFGVIAVLPAAAWYLHAKNLWHVYGNSLGISNEYHWIGWDFFTDSSFINGIFRIELLSVWSIFGVAVAAFAVWKGIRDHSAKHALVWLLSAVTIYIIAARTTSEDWASYYHIFSVPSAALLFGFGVNKLADFSRASADTFSLRSTPANILRTVVILSIGIAVFATLSLDARQLRGHFAEHLIEDPSFAFARRIKPLLKNEGLIVASGGHCVDEKGYPVAYNASYMFYWLERKGWNVCVEEQSIGKIAEYRASSAKYFVAQKSALRAKASFENTLRLTYPVIAESDEFVAFDLSDEKYALPAL